MIKGGEIDEYPVDVEFLYEDVKDAIKNIEYNGPDIHRVLWAYLFTPLPRTGLADLCRFDSSTVKRKLDKAVDLIMQYLNNRDLLDEVLVKIDQKGENEEDLFKLVPADAMYQYYDYDNHMTVEHKLPRTYIS